MMHIPSPLPKTSDDWMEHAIKAAGADKAPRITPTDIEANIVSEHYFTAADGVLGAQEDFTELEVPLPLSLLTFCVLVLRNGFTVTGESACASPENFNTEIGRKNARENAINKLWPLMGYELKSRLAREAAAPSTFQDRVRTEAADLGEKLDKLRTFRLTETFAALPDAERERLADQYVAMLSYYVALSDRIDAFGAAA